ncbi:MAG: Lipopolysaccharide export system protein LptA [uncultured Campylobacterales bacterium]|uniref:Lipopolysaccharide export system protein LptA n=1 Tax=uncultured Campylobacterales bacterium TaxID=352960 RepID=A0A6S6SL02_9BACT|nr:MAG: Lipopolysaccharide export system protein LptA [uncultured Campylobacterales bacterium]
MKKIIFLIVTTILSANSSLNIEADKFEANVKKLESKFVGNVYISKDNNNIFADKVTVKLRNNKKPISYVAQKNVKINISMNGKKYEGNTDKLSYFVDSGIYRLEGNSKLKELNTTNVVTGDKIIIDTEHSVYKIEGDDTKRVEFIYNIDEKE